MRRKCGELRCTQNRKQPRGCFSEITWSHGRKQMSSSVDNSTEAAEVNSGHFAFLSHFSALWIRESIMLHYSAFAPRKLLLNYFQHGRVQRSLCTDSEEVRLNKTAPLASCVLLSQSAKPSILVFSSLSTYKGTRVSILKDYYQS